MVDEVKFGASRDDIYKQLVENDIIARKYFYPLINDYECYRNEYDSKLTPIAKKISDNVLTIPMYADLNLEDVDRICDAILNKKGKYYG